MPTVTMSLEDFTTLASWAELYGQSQSNSWYVTIRERVEKIERANGITRYFLFVHWRDRNSPFVTQDSDTSDWPPLFTTQLMRYTIPWTRDEVMAAITQVTPHPFDIQVTEDRSGTVCWTDIDTYYG
jgi:hypothetical protein